MAYFIFFIGAPQHSPGVDDVWPHFSHRYSATTLHLLSRNRQAHRRWRDMALPSRSGPLAVPVRASLVVAEQPRLVLPLQRAIGIVLGRRLHALPAHVDVHAGVGPAHAVDPFRGDDHLLARPPVPGVDDHVADGPFTIVDEKILDVSDVAVRSLDVVTGDVANAPDAWIAAGRRHRTGRPSFAQRPFARVWRRTPAIGSAPVVRVPVVLRVRFLVLPLHGLLGVD